MSKKENNTIDNFDELLDDFINSNMCDSDVDESDENCDADCDDDDTDDDTEEEQKEMLRSMKQQVENVIKPFTNVIDLKGFKIATRAKSAADVLKTVSEGPTATWVLLDSGCPFTCTSLGVNL